MQNLKIKIGKFYKLIFLAIIKFFYIYKALKIIVIYKYINYKYSVFKIILLFFKYYNNSKQFLIIYFIINFGINYFSQSIYY